MTRLRLLVAVGVMLSGCTPIKGEDPEPYAVPTMPETWPGIGASSLPPWIRYRMGEQAVLLRATWLEAQAGRGIAYGYEYSEREYPWVEATSEALCSLMGCVESCVAQIWLPEVSCGTGLGEYTDIISVRLEGCGPDREYKYDVSYDPLTLGDPHVESEIPELEILPELH